MPHRLIQSPETLLPVCESIAQAEHIAFDTEFIRQKTYRPQLCLIQIAVGENIHCVDPLAVTDLSPLIEALHQTEVIIHSARQDIEAVYLAADHILSPVFDTQVAAGLVGLGDQISYSALVKQLLDVDLGKGETRTNWAQRPLSDAQIRYAEDDVRFLLQLYAPLVELLSARERTEWHQEECLRLGDKSLYVPDPDSAWKKVKGTRPLNASQRRIMKRLAAWREVQADARDRPRKWIIDDAVIVDIALAEPQSGESVVDMLGDNQHYLKRCSDEIFAQVQLARGDAIDEAPQRADEREQKLVKKCMALLRHAGTQHDISPALLGTRKDIVAIIRGEPNSLLNDWRLDLVGRQLQETIASF